MEQKNKHKNNKEQIITVIICVLIAFGLWLYISSTVNPVDSRKVTGIKVNLKNEDALVQNKLVLLKQNEYTVDLVVEGLRRDLYKIDPKQFKVEADLGAYVLGKGDNEIPVIITPPSNYKVKNAYYTVKVKLDTLERKSIPVKVVYEGEVKSGYFRDEAQTVAKPSEIAISGAATYVNKVEYAMVRADVKNLDKDVTMVLPIKAVDAKGNAVDNIDVEKAFTEVVIPIKKVKTVGIKINTKGNLNKDVIFKGLRAVQEKIDIAGKDTDLNAIVNLETEVIDLSKISPDSYGGTIEVKLVVPANVKLVNSSGTIQVRVDVGKFVQKTITLEIAVKNLSSSFTALLEKQKISIVISGEESVVNSIKPETIGCYVDLKTAVEGENTVNIIVDNLPSGVTMASMSSNTTKVTITKQ